MRLLPYQLPGTNMRGTGPQVVCHLPPGLPVLLNSSLALEVEDPGQCQGARAGGPGEGIPQPQR